MEAKMEETLAEIGKAVADLRAAHDAEIAELKKRGATDPVIAEQVSKISEKLNALDEMKGQAEQQAKLDRRVADLEDRIERSRRGKDAGMSEDEKKHLDAFASYVRNPHDVDAKQALGHATKTVSGATVAAGGYAIPEVISRVVDEKLQDLSPLRQVVDVTPVGTSDYKELVDVNGESYEWVGEAGTRSQQTEPTLAECAPTMGTINAYYWANEEATDDLFIDVQNWLTRAAARAFAVGEGAAFVTGNGTNKPTGIFNTTPVSTGDEDSPARAFGTVQYFATGKAYDATYPFGSLDVTSPGFHYPDNVFINCMMGLKTGYRAGAVWLMNRTTIGHVMKIRDNEGRSIWQQSMSAGQPSMLLGQPVIEFPDLADVGTNALPIAFGNFREGYLFVERHGLRVTIDEVTKPGAIKWNIRKRVGGKIRNDDAIKAIKLAAS